MQDHSADLPAVPLTVHTDTDETEPDPEPGHTAATEDEDEGETAIAEYEYEAQEENELSFPEGAVITNIERVDESWWAGHYGGKEGLFPGTLSLFHF
jgi:drebrin-like protein